MKKLFLTLSLMVAPAALFAMQPAQKTINLIVGVNTFEVPQSIAMEAETLKHMAEDLGLTEDLVLSAQLDPKTIGLVAQIMWSYYSHKDLKNKALLDAIEKDVSLKNVPLINLIQVFNYLDFPIGLALVARAIAKDQSLLKQFLQDKGLKDLRPLVAKYYYLLHGKNLIDENSYGFSIQEYLDYQPQLISSKRNRESLNLSNMRLNSLEGLGAIAGHANLQELNLEDNQLNTLTAGTFNGLANLKRLYLSRNQLSALPAEIFNGLANLQTLNLSRNQLSALPAQIFNDLANLRELDLGSNKWSALPVKIFNGLTNLQGLYLNNNQLSMLPEAIFNGLVNLQWLSLDNNQLRTLPARIFNGLTNLLMLYLYNNQLSVLPAGIFNGLAHLQHVKLNHNQFSALPAEIFNSLAHLLVLDLDHNQLDEANKNELLVALPLVNIQL